MPKHSRVNTPHTNTSGTSGRWAIRSSAAGTYPLFLGSNNATHQMPAAPVGNTGTQSSDTELVILAVYICHGQQMLLATYATVHMIYRCLPLPCVRVCLDNP